ncbi:MAG: hypothetical protein GXP38_04615 [Chloroflexi bacterium]|nr:hypothetical protein [Chloroflexota bacterium]
MLDTAKKSVQKTVRKIEEVHSKNPVTKVARTVILASLGTVALGREEIQAIVDKLVEKGEVTEEEGRKLVSDLLNRSKKDAAEIEDRVTNLLDERINAVLEKMNLPDKKDIESLSRKVSTLSKKVNELDKKLAEQSKKAA